MPVIAAIGGIALIGYLIAQGMRVADEQREFRAANGYSLDEVFQALTGGFDRNGDGRLVYDAILGMRTLSEGSRVTTRTYSEPLSGWGIPTGTVAVKERRTTRTIEPLLRKADTDHDGIATKVEILAVLRAYDPDGNNRVTTSQRDQLLAEFGSIVAGSDTRVVGIIPPAPAAKR